MALAQYDAQGRVAAQMRTAQAARQKNSSLDRWSQIFSKKQIFSKPPPPKAHSHPARVWFSAGTNAGGWTSSTISVTSLSSSSTTYGGDDWIFYTQQRELTDGDYKLPDGAVLKIAADGSYRIEDATAKITYRANRVREFNRFINASDLLEKFIDDAALLPGIVQSNILQIPLNAFIHWLVLKAAQQDGDPTDGLPSVESALRLPCSA